MLAATQPLLQPRKAKWTPREDNQLRAAIRIWGTESWNRISIYIPGRTGKQCRERWIAQIAPTISKEVWHADEDRILLDAHAISGNRWTEIKAQLPGRSSLSIKNRWHWLNRRQVRAERGRRASQTPAADPEVVEISNPAHRMFPMIDDEFFGRGFEDFRTRMLMEQDGNASLLKMDIDDGECEKLGDLNGRTCDQ
jgi:hypothetical protein